MVSLENSEHIDGQIEDKIGALEGGNFEEITKALNSMVSAQDGIRDQHLGRRTFLQILGAISATSSFSSLGAPIDLKAVTKGDLTQFSSHLTCGLIGIAREAVDFRELADKAFGISRATYRYLLEGKLESSEELTSNDNEMINKLYVVPEYLEKSIYQFQRLSMIGTELRSLPVWAEFKEQMVGASLNSIEKGRELMVKRSQLLRTEIQRSSGYDKESRDSLIKELDKKVENLKSFIIDSPQCDQELFELSYEIDDVIEIHNETTGEEFIGLDTMVGVVEAHYEKAEKTLLRSLGLSDREIHQLKDELSEYGVEISEMIIGGFNGLPLDTVYINDDFDAFIPTIDNLKEYWAGYQKKALKEALFYDRIFKQTQQSVSGSEKHSDKIQPSVEDSSLKQEEEVLKDVITCFIKDGYAHHSLLETGEQFSPFEILDSLSQECNLKAEFQLQARGLDDERLGELSGEERAYVLIADEQLTYVLSKCGEDESFITGVLLPGDTLFVGTGFDIYNLNFSSAKPAEGRLFVLTKGQ